MNRSIRFLIDLLFPIECLGCGKEKTFLCQNCEEFLPPYQGSFCLFCQKPSAEGKPCLDCATRHALDGVLVASDFDSALVRRLIHAFKYSGVQDLKKPLGRMIVRCLRDNWSPGVSQGMPRDNDRYDTCHAASIPIIIPLPLHKSRLRARGFNQAELLAQEVSQALGWPMRNDILVRTRHTDQQVGLDCEERQENVKGAFEVRDGATDIIPVMPPPQGANSPAITGIIPVAPFVLTGQTILLIDDVTTTGATLEEAAKVLKAAGAKQVWGAVAAKG